MKLHKILILTVMSSHILVAQLKLSGTTNETTFLYGESIFITIKALNLGSTAETLHFGSGCEFDYFVDSVNVMAYNRIACTANLHDRIIAPKDSAQWGGRAEPLMAFSITPASLDTGRHSVVGYVGQYASDTIWITVSELAGVRNPPGTVLRYSLENNYPNPFNPATWITFTLPHRSGVELSIFNLSGIQVAALIDKTMDSGIHTIEWNASSSPSGVYICRLRAGPFSSTRKLLLVR
jgi:hypothetical protein